MRFPLGILCRSVLVSVHREKDVFWPPFSGANRNYLKLFRRQTGSAKLRLLLARQHNFGDWNTAKIDNCQTWHIHQFRTIHMGY